MAIRKHHVAQTLRAFPKLLFVAFWAVTAAAGAAAETVKGDASRGAKAWADHCDRCHEMRDPQEFRDDQWRVIVTHMRLRAGFTGQQTRDITTFLQSANYTYIASEGTAVAATPNSGADTSPTIDGEAAYGQTCVACHGADGKGMIPGVPDMTASGGPLSKADDILVNNIVNGFQSPGAAMAMPPRGGNSQLSDADVAAILKYMKETFAP